MRAMLAILLTLAAVPALAHPGAHHASLLETLLHLLSQPDHLARLALALVCGGGAALLAVLYSRRAP